jgi:hypothetical protein
MPSPALFHLTQKTVISTEAVHSFTVSSAAEKSASLPIPFQPHRAKNKFQKVGKF